MYDFLVVGAGLFGCSFARAASDRGKRCLVLEKRSIPGGNCATCLEKGIVCHLHGAHIFHTSHQAVWDFVRRFSDFQSYHHRVRALSHGREIPLPIHMGTFRALWGDITVDQARSIIASQIVPCENPQTVEALALSTLGRDIYEALIRGYTQKQWGRPCDQLPASILKRIPLRFDENDQYFSDPHQAIPKHGYTPLAAEMLRGIQVRYGTDFLQSPDFWSAQARCVIYTGAPDALFRFRYGPLEYRSLRFEHEWLPQPVFQSLPVINYTDMGVAWTRIIEHKLFSPSDTPQTLITREYPASMQSGLEPYYPIADSTNLLLYRRYISDLPPYLLLGGRLGLYRYMNMDDTIHAAITLAREVSS